jgi:hypothetical protein
MSAPEASECSKTAETRAKAGTAETANALSRFAHLVARRMPISKWCAPLSVAHRWASLEGSNDG